MTDPTPNRHSADFNTVMQPAGAEPEPPRHEPSARRWLLPTAAGVLAVLGAGALIAAAFSPTGSAAAPASAPSPTAPMSAASAAPSRTPTPTAGGAAAVDVQDLPISQLADPDWVSRIAQESGIPERALAAYAGAALSVAQTNPGCKIGWNTLAAIGQVESEHGTMNGAHLNDRGVATPSIIGIPLDGNGTAKVPDTDHGRYDGDSQWDHAVGPMQFIPSTWAQVAQDGNKDGAKDINQMDDAALAAALHLCDVGGDLTIAQNWITAIGAYNDSVDYNNKVAAAVTQYASLN